MLGAACSKDKKSAPQQSDPLRDSIVNIISLNAGESSASLGTVSFLKYKQISTGLISPGDVCLLYLQKSNEYPYKVKFLNGRNLIHPTKIYYAGNGPGYLVVRFAIDDKLKGKPILEIYNDDTKEVARRIIADGDSCAIEVFAGWSDSGPVDTNAVRARYGPLLRNLDTNYFQSYPGTLIP